jgi:type IV pilus assembly protein PilW
MTRGFTLIELLIAGGIGVFLVGAVASSFISQRRLYASREQVMEVQQNVRGALDFMIREIAMAGYDPTDTAGAGIVSATANAIQFTMDLNRNRDTNDLGENVTYGLYDADGDGDADLGRDLGDGNGNQLVAENISVLTLMYTLADGTTDPNPADPSQIRSVNVTLTARTAQPDPHRTTQDGYRTRTLTLATEIRNMGL